MGEPGLACALTSGRDAGSGGRGGPAGGAACERGRRSARGARRIVEDNLLHELAGRFRKDMGCLRACGRAPTEGAP